MSAKTTDSAWYEILYADFDEYDDEPYTQQTRAEVDFIEGKIGSASDLQILDVGCGTGRHSLELARRGYRQLTGIDLSPSMLEQARAKAEAARLKVEFVQRDARRLDYEAAYDVVLMLCEGGFSLVEMDEMDRQILRGVARALRSGGILLMTAPSAAFMLNRPEANADFNPITLREQFTLEKGGENVACTQRYYTFPELKWLLEAEGFQKIRPFSVNEKGYQNRMPAKDEFEFGMVALKA